MPKTPMRAAIMVGLAVLIATSSPAWSQGLVKGVEQGARQGSKAAGPVGGVLGGAIGGVVGVVTGVLGVPTQNAAPASRTSPVQGNTPKPATKAERRQAARAKQVPQPVPVTPEQIVAASDANIERIKAELKLMPEQEKHWGGFNSAMHYLGRNGADRLNLRNTRAKRDPPDDIIEQMRNEAQFLNDRAVDQRNVADAAEPLFASLDDMQKATFITEMVKLSRERGLD
jgi:hypothetical protein